MDPNHRQQSLDYWEAVHTKHGCGRAEIRTDDWLEAFDGIIRKAVHPILDLGCGGGNDTLYLIGKGKQVCACDQSQSAVQRLKQNFPEVTDVRCFNMLDGLPFGDSSFEVVIADLCLHYFTKEDTGRVIADIRRILVPGGHLILRVNSIRDIHHGAGQGTPVEHHVYEMENGTLKRFFDESDIRFFFRDFSIAFLKEETMTRYIPEKRLFRVCVRKEEHRGEKPERVSRQENQRGAAV